MHAFFFFFFLTQLMDVPYSCNTVAIGEKWWKAIKRASSHSLGDDCDKCNWDLNLKTLAWLSLFIVILLMLLHVNRRDRERERERKNEQCLRSIFWSQVISSSPLVKPNDFACFVVCCFYFSFFCSRKFS